MKFKLSILLLVAVLHVQAQENSLFKDLTFVAEPKESLKSAMQTKIKSIEIISNIVSDSLMGIMPSDIKNTRQSLILNDGLDNYLKKYVNRYINKNVKEGIQLLWVVNDFVLGIDSVSDRNIKRFIKVNTEVYNYSGIGYKYKGNYDTLLIYNNKLPLEQIVTNAIQDLINFSEVDSPIDNKALDMATSTNENTKFNQKVSSLSEVKEKVNSSKNLPILKVKNYKYGVYRNYDEFKNDAPSISNFIVDVDTNNAKVKIFEFDMADSIKIEIVNPWGISIGTELYKFDEGYLYPIEKDGNFFVLSKYLNPMKRQNQAYFWRQAIGDRLTNDNPYDDRFIIRKPVGKDEITLEAIKIDRNTVEITQ